MLKIEKYSQDAEIYDEYEALFSVIIPILKGLLYSLNREIVNNVGGYNSITPELFARLYREGDGDCGICFEYAIHDAIVRKVPSVIDRIDTALVRFCRIRGGDTTSILFGAEKFGKIQLIDSVEDYLTDDSSLLSGSVGKPVKLKRHIQGVISALRDPNERIKLPNSINGLWKADLFVGKNEPDKWVGATVKKNPAQLEAANGLRIAIVPCRQGRRDNVEYNESKNLVMCPIPYDQSFIETFYEGWNVVRFFIKAGGNMPREDIMPNGLNRIVCKELVERKKFPILRVIEALEILQQQGLLRTEENDASVVSEGENKINRLIAPSSLYQ